MGDVKHFMHPDTTDYRQRRLSLTWLQAGNIDFIYCFIFHVVTLDVLLCYFGGLTATMRGVNTTQHNFHHIHGL